MFPKQSHSIFVAGLFTGRVPQTHKSLILSLVGKTFYTLCDQNPSRRLATTKRRPFSDFLSMCLVVVVIYITPMKNPTAGTSTNKEVEEIEKEEVWIHSLLQDSIPRFRPDGSLSTSYRSIEHVIQSQSCVANRHLHRLIRGSEEWARQFICLLVKDERCANISCQKSKSLKKELVEGVSMIERVEHLIAKLNKHRYGKDVIDSSGKGLTLLDLCSGKGVAGTMLAVRFSHAQVNGLDIRPPSERERHLHDGFLPNFSRKTGNVYDEKLMQELISGVKQRDKESKNACLIVGTHLCGDLSRVAIDLMAQYPQHVAAAVIAPCCLQRQKAPIGFTSFSGNNWGYDTAQVARQLGRDPFALWLDRLYGRAQAHDKTLFHDKDMLSSKNAYILLCRWHQSQEESYKEEQKQQLCREVNSCSEMVGGIRL